MALPGIARVVGAAVCLFFAAGAPGAELWLYVSENLQVSDRVERLEKLFVRAKQAGYTHVLLSDSKFSRLGAVPDVYFKNVARVRDSARGNHLELVPAVFPVGYSNDLLWNDPDLAEGPPVRGARFVVRGGVARLESEAAPRLRGGDFSDLKAWDWKDDTIRSEDGAVVIRDPRGANARIVQRVKLLPWRQYHFSVRVRTRDFRGQPEVKVLAADGGRALNFDHLGVAQTQEWRTHHVVFNSLQYTQVGVYLGAWGADSGELRFDDAMLEEVGLLNLVRRDGAPLLVRSPDGRELKEGMDFEPVRDPRMGHVQWPGDYDVHHESPVIRMRGEWPENTELRVSYQHVASIYDGQVMMDIAEPKSGLLLRDQARRVHEIFRAPGYFMSHDEIRVLGWSDAFRRAGRTPGQLVGDNARLCVGYLHELAPGARVYSWSDMFDPHHNAVPGPYYLVNGSLSGSWEGLDPSVIVMNWNHGKRDESLRFFSERGHRQLIAGYYDNPMEELDQWLVSARGVKGVLGYMYTTWRADFDKLEAFAKRVREGGGK